MIACTACHLQYKTLKIGTALEVMTQDNQPYQLFAGDRLECPGCKHVIVRTGPSPLAEHFQPQYKGFADTYEKHGMLDRAWVNKKEKDKAHGTAT